MCECVCVCVRVNGPDLMMGWQSRCERGSVEGTTHHLSTHNLCDLPGFRHRDMVTTTSITSSKMSLIGVWGGRGSGGGVKPNDTRQRTRTNEHAGARTYTRHTPTHTRPPRTLPNAESWLCVCVWRGTRMTLPGEGEYRTACTAPPFSAEAPRRPRPPAPRCPPGGGPALPV